MEMGSIPSGCITQILEMCILPIILLMIDPSLGDING